MGESVMAFGKRVQLARRHFFEEGKRPVGLVPEGVIRSWERSRELGLATADRRVFNPIARHEKSLVEERNRSLITCALPEMERLHQSLGQGGWALACIDTQGVVVSAVCGSSAEFRVLNSIFQVGRNLSEAAVGTNGPGSALAEARPVVVRAAEHFLDEVQPFSCAAVPLFDPSGRLAGVLDATRMNDGEPLALLEVLGTAARAIEKGLLAEMSGALTLGFHYRRDLLGTPFEGLVVFDEEGGLLGANQTARQLLGLGGGDEKEGGFEQLFDCPPDLFRRALAGRLESAVVHSDGGLRFEARFQAARAGSVLARLREGVQRIHALASSAVPAGGCVTADPGDGVLVPTPSYAGFWGDLEVRDGLTIVPVPTSVDEGFKLSAERLDRAVAGAGRPVRALLFTTPNNPVGTVYTSAEIAEVLAWGERAGVHVVLDEIYALSVHGARQFTSGARVVPRLGPLRHIVWAFSKDFAASGLRCGVLISENPAVLAAVDGLAYWAATSGDTQHLLGTLLADEAWLAGYVAENRRRLAAAYAATTRALTAAGVPFVPAEAGFFCLLDLRRFLDAPTWAEEDALWRDMLARTNVNLTPGSACRAPEPGFFRLCFAAVAPEQAAEAVARLGAMLAS